jgi:predicted cupin superfamily sugar epimerase
MMHSRAAQLIHSLNLKPHPEGGFFREVHRSQHSVQPQDERPGRAALTAIYFLLAEGQISRWHRVRSDEVWHFFDGDPLELLVTDPAFDGVTRSFIGPASENMLPMHVVPANYWQAARPTGAYALVGCTVGPGFDFADFVMLKDSQHDRELLSQRQPTLADLV